MARIPPAVHFEDTRIPNNPRVILMNFPPHLSGYHHARNDISSYFAMIEGFDDLIYQRYHQYYHRNKLAEVAGVLQAASRGMCGVNTHFVNSNLTGHTLPQIIIVSNRLLFFWHLKYRWRALPPVYFLLSTMLCSGLLGYQ